MEEGIYLLPVPALSGMRNQRTKLQQRCSSSSGKSPRAGSSMERLPGAQVTWRVPRSGTWAGFGHQHWSSCRCQRAFGKAGHPDVSPLCSVCFEHKYAMTKMLNANGFLPLAALPPHARPNNSRPTCGWIAWCLSEGRITAL